MAVFCLSFALLLEQLDSMQTMHAHKLLYLLEII